MVDEPTELPEGTVVELVVVDPNDELDRKEHAKLYADLKESLADADAG